MLKLLPLWFATLRKHVLETVYGYERPCSCRCQREGCPLSPPRASAGPTTVQRSTAQVFSLAAQRQFRGLCMLSSERRFREQKFRMSGAILVDRRAGVGAIIHLAFDRSSIFFQFDQRASARGRGKKGSALGGTTLLSRGSAERNGSGCENCRRSTHFNLPALLGLSACPL